MIERSTNIQAALRSRQRGFLLNPFRFEPSWPSDPYWSSVQLLLHFDGTDGSKTFTDYSSSPKTVSSIGASSISTAQAKFGPSSLFTNGTGGGHASVAHTSALNVGSGDFCIEFFVYASSIPSNVVLFNKQSGTASGYPFQGLLTPTGAIIFRSYATGEILRFTTTSAAGVVTTNTWHHLAFSRVGSNLYAYVNGVLVASTTYTGALPDSTQAMQIGAYSDSAFRLWGYIDEFRYTVGNGRYPTTFTPPTAAFPNS